MIELTERAAKKAVELATKEGKAPVLRVGVRGGGCSGMSYVLDFDESPRDGDQKLEQGGLTVLVDPKSLQFLAGTTIDYEQKLMGGGFRFKNPNEKKSCGCGESFGV